MTSAVLILAVFWPAYSNGANDNFKGVATLYGSGTISYRKAVTWTTIATMAGSVLSILLAGSLAKSFSGKGLVPPELAQSGELLISVAAAGAGTILLATFLGMPTSTTHALTGALGGIALIVGYEEANLGELCGSFFLPLVVSPFLALGAAAMAIGGLLNSRKVAETMGKRITDLNPGQGLLGNLVTVALVLGASRLGVPVSTTHVSCGAIFGIGMVSRTARWKTIAQILATWLTTLPIGAALGAVIYWTLTRTGS